MCWIMQAGAFQDAAKILGVSTGQLVSFLQGDGPLFAEVNRRRREADFGVELVNSP